MLGSLIVWVIIGVVAGWIVSAIQRRNFGREWPEFTLLGMAGSVLGGFLMRLIGGSGGSGLSLYSVLVSVVGAFVLLWLVRALRNVAK